MVNIWLMMVNIWLMMVNGLLNGFSINFWVPQTRWMVCFMETPHQKWMRTGGTPVLGNNHICTNSSSTGTFRVLKPMILRYSLYLEVMSIHLPPTFLFNPPLSSMIFRLKCPCVDDFVHWKSLKSPEKNGVNHLSMGQFKGGGRGGLLFRWLPGSWNGGRPWWWTGTRTAPKIPSCPPKSSSGYRRPGLRPGVMSSDRGFHQWGKHMVNSG